MSFERKYRFVGWDRTVYHMTPLELFTRVQQDSKSNYNWIASATELTKVCNHSGFPTRYSVAIKLLILNCFANLELQKTVPSTCESTDSNAVYSCYNSLPKEDPTVARVKAKYLRAIIKAVTIYTHDEERLPIHPGQTYKKMVEDWKAKKFDECASAEYINFDKLRKKLYSDFEEMIRKAEENGTFDEENSEFWATIHLTDSDE